MSEPRDYDAQQIADEPRETPRTDEKPGVGADEDVTLDNPDTLASPTGEPEDDPGTDPSPDRI